MKKLRESIQEIGQEFQGFSVDITKAVRAPVILTKTPEKQDRRKGVKFFRIRTLVIGGFAFQGFEGSP
jgi:hypothetical protein